MLIQSYTDNKSTAPGPRYTVLLNPESFSHTVEVSSSKTNTPGQNDLSSKFDAIGDEQVGFDLVLDGTGAGVGKVIDVSTEIAKLRNVIFKYQGKLHSPYYLQLSWGTLLFNCHLTKFDVIYTLFKPDGSPLRAKVSMTFLGFTDPETTAKRADK